MLQTPTNSIHDLLESEKSSGHFVAVTVSSFRERYARSLTMFLTKTVAWPNLAFKSSE